MSTPTSTSRTSTWIGIALGVVLLGLVAVFAIVLPKTAGADEGSTSGGDLSLPDTLPGDYTAADLPDAFTGQYADQADQISQAQAKSREHGDKVLADVLDEPAATRTYASKDLKTAVFVQAFRAPGGAFAPDSLPDPEQPQGAQGAPELVGVGDGACIVTRTPAQPGQPVDESAPPTYAQCQVSEGELTVQVGARGVPEKDMVDLADHVFGLLQDQ